MSQQTNTKTVGGNNNCNPNVGSDRGREKGDFVKIQTATFWIYHVHPTRKKRASNSLSLT